ncbi:hypothetical protein [Jeotgalibaca porci]|uniref:hypothetical protein n=1 Tax=Jeotgalibaca porci TaxID=1868793 RepID=UPI0035A0C358
MLNKVITIKGLMSFNLKGLKLDGEDSLSIRLLSSFAELKKCGPLFDKVDKWNAIQLSKIKWELEELKSERDVLFEENARYYEEFGELEEF